MTKEELVGRKIQVNNFVYTLVEEGEKLGLISDLMKAPFFGFSYSPYTIKEWNENINRRVWKLLPIENMQDYKQVDPKTVKFIFKDMKINVKNADESKWVQEVAFANGVRWSSRQAEFKHLNAKALYFDRYGISKTDDADNFFQTNENKEITIQDILNMQQIEVGDIVGFLRSELYGDRTKTVASFGTSASGNKIVRYVEGGFDKLADVKLVSKGSKQEIIGYETVVDLPRIPKGTKFSNHLTGEAAHYYPFTAIVGGKTYSYDRADVQDTKFFKPIYKAKDIELKFSKYTAKLSKEDGLVFSGNDSISYSQLKELLKWLGAKYKVGPFDISIIPQYVNVGCKQFTAEDVNIVIKAVQQLDK